LALRQTEIVLDGLKILGVGTDLRIIKTSGDVFLDKPLHQLSGWGVFVAEIDEKMLSGELDLAVHSMKDIPTKRPVELEIAAILKRDSPYDILVSRGGQDLEGLKGEQSLEHPACAGQLSSKEPDRIFTFAVCAETFKPDFES